MLLLQCACNRVVIITRTLRLTCDYIFSGSPCINYQEGFLKQIQQHSADNVNEESHNAKLQAYLGIYINYNTTEAQSNTPAAKSTRMDRASNYKFQTTL